MRDPENVLNSLQEHSAQSGYVYDRLYRNLFNREFFLQAYQNIYASQGNMTAGTDGKTIDAMSLERVDRLIAALKDESYQPKPSRRTYIPKKNGKLRPLGIPSIDDKLVQEVVRMLLESIYENSFEDTSHGFRPNKSCHTALRMIQNRFTRCKWFVEGDIKGFFDNIDHNVMIGILRKRIKDERFLRLIRKFLNAGYMEDNQVHQSYSGTPQGGIISPILANIYLDQFDKYMAEFKKRFDRGNKRAVNVEYRKLSDMRIRLKRKLAKTQSEEEKQSLLESIRELDKVHKSIPCKNPMDANFRRLQYVRYADDFLIGIIGAKEDAQAVKQEIGAYIAEQLKLELSDEKTLVTKATDRAKFLGFEIRVTPQSNHTKKTKSGSTARNYSGHVMLEVPTSAIQKKLLEDVYKRQDNMLRITNDGRKLALDMRLINPLAADDPNGKVAVCARNVFRIWEQTKEKRSAQLVFCDLSTPTTDGSFSVYDDLKKKLMDAGIPEEEIAFIHTADSEAKKKELFSKVRAGQVRVLLGSTAKMGAGTNVRATRCV